MPMHYDDAKTQTHPVRRYGFDPEFEQQLLELGVHSLQWVCVGERTGDNYGGFIIRYYEVNCLSDGDDYPISDLSEEVAKEITRRMFPSERCMHSYDCCGNYYSNGGDYVGFIPYYKNSCWLVRESITQNV